MILAETTPPSTHPENDFLFWLKVWDFVAVFNFQDWWVVGQLRLMLRRQPTVFWRQIVNLWQSRWVQVFFQCLDQTKQLWKKHTCYNINGALSRIPALSLHFLIIPQKLRHIVLERSSAFDYHSQKIDYHSQKKKKSSSEFKAATATLFLPPRIK